MLLRRVAYALVTIMILVFCAGLPVYMAMGQGDGNSQSVTVTVTAQPAYRPPTSWGGWGGWGSSPECPPGQMSSAGKVTAEGSVIRAFVVESFDKRLSLILHQGIIVLTRHGVCPACIGIHELLEPPSPPGGAHIIGVMYDAIPDETTFTPPATLKYSYDANDIPEGVAQESLVIACYDGARGKWIKLDSVVDTEVKIITAKISQFNDLAVLGYKAEVPMPAAFECNSLSISPTQVNTGETVNITVLVTNIGGQPGNYLVILKINGAIAAEKNIVLNAGASEYVSFSTAKDVAGTYSVDVNGLTGTFVVKEKTVPPPAKAVNWWLIGGIIIIATISVAVIFLFRKTVHKPSKK